MAPRFGGPGGGMQNIARRQNAEAAKHALLLETHIDPPTAEQEAAVRAMVARNSSSDEERDMFLAMLLGENESHDEPVENL